jgi:hypothetical protein
MFIFRRCAILAMFCIASLTAAQAQYWGERAQEKGFEEEDFFFQPFSLNPLGIGSFRNVTRGLVDQPLLNMSVNPSHLTLDSVGAFMFYTDFRSAKTITDESGGGYYPYPLFGVRTSVDIAYPYYYATSRRVLEPVFSGAILIRPMPELTLGATYQLMLQDEKYYYVPQDVYRSNIESDFAGNKAAASSSMPITDVSGGDDRMRQRGHMGALYGSWSLSDDIRLGAKIGRTLFNRAGVYGSSNFWGNTLYNNGSSLWSSSEGRSQSYAHWEVSGGATVAINERLTAGVTGGYLWGDATQALRQVDTSYSLYGTTPYQSLYSRSGNKGEEWRHAGRTRSLGVDLSYAMTPTTTLRLLVEHRRTSVDLRLTTSILDTSFSTSSYNNNGTTQNSMSSSYLMDRRNGTGDRTSTTNRIMGSVDWRFSEKARLSIGGQIDWLNTSTTTIEAVTMRGASRYASDWGPYAYLYSNAESKDLLWDFSAELVNFQIPIMLFLEPSEYIEVLLGLNRVMSTSTVREVTTALIASRVSNNNGTELSQQNFGERYTTPTAETSDIRTTFLAGIKATVSQHVGVRLMVVPNFRDVLNSTQLMDLQWWIGVEVL